MTFSIAGRCARTGMFGIAITTSSMAVGSRCAFARAGIGAVLTQHRTDPRLGPLGLDLLSTGSSASDTVAALVASTPHHDWRQIAVIDRDGGTAHFTGAKAAPAISTATGGNCVAVGNILRTSAVAEAMVAAFEEAPDAPLAARLLAAVSAGDGAGGEFRPLRSSALLVVHQQTFPFVDLRVDDDPHPIATLTSLWQEYRPLADDFVVRALDPDRV
jgi:uncharacterized Ntn-hydrolase superfamily protein